MSLQQVKKYLSSDVRSPYFFVVGDKQYKGVKDKLSELGFGFIRVSDYCSNNDKLPDIDSLFEHLKTADVNAGDSKLVVLGLGEYLALRGNSEATNILLQLKDLNIGNVKVVLLLRGITAQINGMQADPRFDTRRYCITDNAYCNLSLTLINPSIGLLAMKGIKSLLIEFENGKCGDVAVNTIINLDNSLLTVHKINDAFDGIKYKLPGLNLSRCSGNDIQWSKLLIELTEKHSLDAVFEYNGISSTVGADFYQKIAGSEYKNWLYFIAFKVESDTLSNSYLRFVLDKTDCFEIFKTNVLNAIIEVPHTDKQFGVYYAERKALVEKFPESDIADFVVNNRKYIAESIYKLTDSKKSEREEIIAWVSQNGIIPEITEIYPALASYLKKYVFNCDELSNLLTAYFDTYKRQKVFNILEDSFIEKVDKLAESRDYNRLPSRNEIIDRLNKDDTYLYWLDSLGVEYLAFITELARNRDLSISINIARAELPTITPINRNFYDDWQGDKKVKNNDLDDIKHRDAGGYNFENNALPIHLAKELDIISEVIDKAATELALRNYKHFLIASDHGASRLAVLRRKEEKYETETKGENSGRCCKLFEPYDLPFAAEENGYLILADYGRFKGSRAANVEVHGGASFEEVIVPIIRLSLKDSNITVEMLEESVTIDTEKGIEITLFSKTPLENVSVVVNGKRYAVSNHDDNHYKTTLPDIKKAGEYLAEVYTGDDIIGEIQIIAHSKSGKVNDAFDDLF